MSTAGGEWEMIVCPNCDGRKGSNVLACGPGGSGMCWMPCFFCKGEGQVTTYQGIQFRQGRRLREARLAKDYTTREVAKLYGCTLSRWSDLEHGRCENLVAIDDAANWLKTMPARSASVVNLTSATT